MLPNKPISMRSLYSFLLVLLFLSFSRQATADDVLIAFGQNLAGAPAWKYKGGGTNLNAVAHGKPLLMLNQDSLHQTFYTVWYNPPVRNTAIPENNTAGGGGPAGAVSYPVFQKNN